MLFKDFFRRNSFFMDKPNIAILQLISHALQQLDYIRRDWSYIFLALTQRL